MKVLAINGSSRDGNTEFMLKTILNSTNAETEIINLKDKKINFCCDKDYYCEKIDGCDDDFDEISQKLENSDILILGSPCYFSNVSALMKNFMDRCNPYWYNKKLKGKKAFLMGVGGSGNRPISEMIGRMKAFIGLLELEMIGEYIAKAEKPNDLSKNEEVIRELKKIGSDLNV